MKVVSLTCPGCGANLSIEDGRKQCFCQYCGMKIMLDDESITYRTVDEARIKEAEVQAMLKMKEMEQKNKQIELYNQSIKYRVIASIIIGIIFCVTAVIGFSVESLKGMLFITLMTMPAIMMVWVIANPTIFESDETNNEKTKKQKKPRK